MLYNERMERNTKKTDRRVRKTEAQLKLGLVRLMQRKSIREITVKELVEEVDINRSTFYLHYTDIFQMLNAFEDELAVEFKECLETISKDYKTNSEKAQAFLLNVFILFDENRELCKALLGPNGDPAFCDKIQEMISHSIRGHINSAFLDNLSDADKIHQFAMSGCFGLIKEWIYTPEEDCDTPEHMASIAFKLLSAVFKSLS